MHPDINGENFHMCGWMRIPITDSSHIAKHAIGSELIQTHNLLHVAILDKSLSPLGPAQPPPCDGYCDAMHAPTGTVPVGECDCDAILEQWAPRSAVHLNPCHVYGGNSPR